MPESNLFALLAVVVAALALFASVIMQLRTLQVSRETTHETLSVTTRAANLQHAIDGLTDDLTQYLTNSYYIDAGNAAKRDGFDVPWPDKYGEYVTLEDLLYDKIRLRLNPNDKLDANLLAEIATFREKLGEAGGTWKHDRDRVVATAQEVFAGKWKQLLEPEHQQGRESAIQTPASRAKRFWLKIKQAAGRETAG